MFFHWAYFFQKRIKAKHVIINIGKNAPVPEPPQGEKWKSVQHDQKVVSTSVVKYGFSYTSM